MNHDFGVGSAERSVSLLPPATAPAGGGGGGAAAPPGHQPYGLKVVQVAPKLVAVTKRIKARKTAGSTFFINCLLSALSRRVIDYEYHHNQIHVNTFGGLNTSVQNGFLDVFLSTL